MAIDGVDDIRKYIEQRKSALQSAILENNYDALQCIYSENNVILFRIHQYMQMQDISFSPSVIFDLGRLAHLCKLCNAVYKAYKKQKRGISHTQTRYQDRIIQILAKGQILHKDLAKALGISSSNLTNIIGRLKTLTPSLIEEQYISKYKYYTLSLAGMEYFSSKWPEQGFALHGSNGCNYDYSREYYRFCSKMPNNIKRSDLPMPQKYDILDAHNRAKRSSNARQDIKNN